MLKELKNVSPCLCFYHVSLCLCLRGCLQLHSTLSLFLFSSSVSRASSLSLAIRGSVVSFLSLSSPMVGSPLPWTQHHPPTSMGSRHSCGDLLVPSAFSACTQMLILWYSCRCLRGMEQRLCASAGTQSRMESSSVWHLSRLLPTSQACVSSGGRKQGSLLPPIFASHSPIPTVLPIPCLRTQRNGAGVQTPHSLETL